jgi:hypothetical protein
MSIIRPYSRSNVIATSHHHAERPTRHASRIRGVLNSILSPAGEDRKTILPCHSG